MSYFQPQNPGIGGLNELTESEEVFLTTFAGLPYSEGDVLTIKSGQLSWEEPMAGATANYTLRYKVDSTDSDVKYLGEADAGSSEDEAVWRIQRITKTTGGLKIEFADGNTNFDNVWDAGSLEYEDHDYGEII